MLDLFDDLPQEVLAFWLQRGVDGFRLHATGAPPDQRRSIRNANNFIRKYEKTAERNHM